MGVCDESIPVAMITTTHTSTHFISHRRGFLRRLFMEDTPAARNFKGVAWLFLGVANTDSLLYDADWQMLKQKHPNNFKLDYALSREQNNKKGTPVS